MSYLYKVLIQFSLVFMVRTRITICNEDFVECIEITDLNLHFDHKKQYLFTVRVKESVQL